MSDLISRSAVIQVLKECHLDEKLFEKDVFDAIKAMPTAYDVDAVVEEVERLSTVNICASSECSSEDCADCVQRNLVNKATEVVRKGGVNE